MKDILLSHPVANLKKEIAKTNIRGYSKMKKAQIVELMMKHKEKFDHIKMYVPKGKIGVTRADGSRIAVKVKKEKTKKKEDMKKKMARLRALKKKK